MAHSPLGHVWCDQCDYRLEIDKFNSRPIEDALRAENERLTQELDEARFLAKLLYAHRDAKIDPLPWWII